MGDAADGVPGDVSIVVVSWNALPWIERCLESVRGHETIVVDHGSTDETREIVRGRFPETRLIEQANVGYGAGLNAGFRASSPRYWLVINSDAWVVADAVDETLAPWRRRFHAWSVERGIPAHLTILFPFVPASRVDGELLASLRTLYAPVAPFGSQLYSSSSDVPGSPGSTRTGVR